MNNKKLKFRYSGDLKTIIKEYKNAGNVYFKDDLEKEILYISPQFNEIIFKSHMRNKIKIVKPVRGMNHINVSLI